MQYRHITVFLVLLLTGLACKKRQPKLVAPPTREQLLQSGLRTGYLSSAFGLAEVLYRPPVGSQEDVLIEGDMLYAADALGASDPRGGLRAVAAGDIGYLWPNGRVPYLLDVSEAQAQAIGLDSRTDFVARIERAMLEWQEDGNGVATGWSFVTAGPQDHNVVVIGTDPNFAGGYAHVGRAGGRQHLKFGPQSFARPSILLHQIGHVIGLHHEHGHPEALRHIKINWQNIEERYKYAFASMPLANGQILAPYDSQSVMHYGPYQYSVGAQHCDSVECLQQYPTLTRLDGLAMEDHTKISEKDYEAARKLRAVIDASFVDPSKLEVKGALTLVAAAASPRLPPYVQLQKDPKVAFHKVTITPAGPPAPGEIQQLLYTDRFFLGALEAGTYELTFAACTLPEVSTQAATTCGPTKTVTFVRPSLGSDEVLRKFEADYSNLAVAWNELYARILVSLSQFRYEIAVCPTESRGDPRAYLTNLSQKYGLPLDNLLRDALLSEYRFVGGASGQAPAPSEHPSGLGLRQPRTAGGSLALTGTSSRSLAEALQEAGGQPVRVDPVVSVHLQTAVAGLDAPPFQQPVRQLAPDLINLPGGERAARSIDAQGPNGGFWATHHRKLLIGGGVAAVAVGLGITFGVYGNKLGIWSASDEQVTQSSPDPYVFAECTELATAQQKLDHILAGLARDLQALEAAMTALQK